MPPVINPLNFKLSVSCTYAPTSNNAELQGSNSVNEKSQILSLKKFSELSLSVFAPSKRPVEIPYFGFNLKS